MQKSNNHKTFRIIQWPANAPGLYIKKVRQQIDQSTLYQLYKCQTLMTAVDM